MVTLSEISISVIVNSHPDPEIRGGAVSNKIFSALRASVWSKNRGAGPSPRFATINGGRLAFVADVI